MKLSMAINTIKQIYGNEMATKVIAMYVTKAVCEELKIEEPEICTYTRRTNETACYVPESKHIGINMYHVNELVQSISASNMKSLYTLVEFIVHETRHAWQYAGNMEIPKNYVSGKTNNKFDEYWNQPIEIDARDYAKKNYQRYCHMAETNIVGMAEYMLEEM